MYMKNLLQNIYEAWGSTKRSYKYEEELIKIFQDYQTAADKKTAKDKKEQEGKSKPSRARIGSPYANRGSNPVEKLAKYPVQILIDKAGFEPKIIKKHWWKDADEKGNQKVDNASYGQFILDELEKGTFTKKDLIKWWQEYEDNILKNKWCDIKWVVKQVDPTRFWDPWRPEDDSYIQKLIAEPEKIITYVSSDNAKWFNMSDEERKEIEGFYADPMNHNMLVKAMKSYVKALQKYRPTNETAAAEIYKNLLDGNVYLDGKRYNLESKLQYSEGGGRTRYQGANDTEDEMPSAIMGMILKAIDDIYGISFDSHIDWDNILDEWNDKKTYGRKFSAKTKEGSKTEEFVKDGGMGIKFNFKDLGVSKEGEKTGSVSSSSFWTYYRHDFELEVTVYGDDEPKYKKVFKGITTASSYYSGGWG